MPRRILLNLLLVFLVTGAGCASSGHNVRRDSRVLTLAEIATVPVVDLYEAVERLRPRWLGAGAARTAVFLNDGYVGTGEALREFKADQIARMRYLNPAEAAASLSVYDTGSRIGGVIVLDTADR
jgi:hypothetical protein